MDEKKLLIVSNRLPVKMIRNKNGLEAIPSSGGLVSVLNTLKPSLGFQWVGWPGLEIPASERKQAESLLQKENRFHPVYLTDREIDHYYHGFSNAVLWPLFHYCPDRVDFTLPFWDDYKNVNQYFAEKIDSLCDDTTFVWIHDYHLFLVPQMLRKRRPNLKIGFFLHIPFPSSEIYRLLPTRKEILEGILGSDLIGFHCHEYERHFISSCKRVLGCKVNGDKIHHGSRTTHAGTFPIGIDFDRFHSLSQSEEVLQNVAQLRKSHGQKKMILGVDRLDYSKGIPNKLRAYELFLEKHPDQQTKSILVQVGLPSRDSVPDYRRLKSEIDNLVGRINGRFGSPNHSPIHYIAHPITFPDLIAFYQMADALLVTSFRDGMNLVCLEYVACQEENCGVPIISEFTGAVHALKNALFINPWDIPQVADSIHEALHMSLTERKQRHRKNFNYVKKNTALRWAESFLRNCTG